MICLVVFPVSTSAQENSDHVIRVGSFEETYNVVNEKGERSGYGYEYLQDIAGYAGWTYKYITINEQIQNIAQKKDTLCRRMYN